MPFLPLWILTGLMKRWKEPEEKQELSGFYLSSWMGEHSTAALTKLSFETSPVPIPLLPLLQLQAEKPEQARKSQPGLYKEKGMPTLLVPGRRQVQGIKGGREQRERGARVNEGVNEGDMQGGPQAERQ